jgi:hypothetical protein
VRWAVGLFAISVACLLWFSTKPYGLPGDFLLKIMLFQSSIALVIGLISGMVTAILQRSLRAGGIVLLGVLFGATLGGTVGLAVGIFVGGAMDRIFPGPTDPDLPNLGAALAGMAVYFFGQIIGAIWGGTDWLAFYSSNHRRREN